MTPENHLAHKGDEIEEWVDLRFFRPLGSRVARAFLPTRVSADHVTLICLITGLVAGHLFLYSSRWLNLAGFALFIVSDIFDSADGQLARLRGTTSRYGRILDGLSDSTRFLNLFAHLAVRVALGGLGWPGALLAAGALVICAVQSVTIEFIKTTYTALGRGEGTIDLPEDVAVIPPGSFFRRFAARSYRNYIALEARLFPRTMSLARRWRAAGSDELKASYRSRVRGILPHCAWLGQNLRFVIIGLFGFLNLVPPGLWIIIVPLNVVTWFLVRSQESAAAALSAVRPRAVPVVVVAEACKSGGLAKKTGDAVGSL